MNLFTILSSIPKSLYFNFRFFPFRKAIRLPIVISYSCDISHVKGKIQLPESISFAMIRIGFHEVPSLNKKDSTRIEIQKNGILEFLGTAHIGKGSKLFIASNAQMIIGDNFAISASSSILCYKKILFGKDIQFSWDCLVMDSDTHSIYDLKNSLVNPAEEIVFEDKIWVGCRCTILKGSHIPSNTIIGACSCVTGQKGMESNSIIVGAPARTLKTIKSWDLKAPL